MRHRVIPAFVLALFLFVGALISLGFAPELQTPDPRVVTVNSSSVATDTNFSGYVWGRYSEADLVYRIDQGTTVNTTSLEIEISPDGTYWYDHAISPTLLADNAADANGYVNDIAVNGFYWRIVANVSTTDTVTPALQMVLR